MTVTTTPFVPGIMNLSSTENHKKIAAFLLATAKHLEPVNSAGPTEEQSVYTALNKDTSKDEGTV
jgi:hypothetical protein